MHRLTTYICYYLLSPAKVAYIENPPTIFYNCTNIPEDSLFIRKALFTYGKRRVFVYSKDSAISNLSLFASRWCSIKFLLDTASIKFLEDTAATTEKYIIFH